MKISAHELQKINDVTPWEYAAETLNMAPGLPSIGDVSEIIREACERYAAQKTDEITLLRAENAAIKAQRDPAR